MKCWDEYISYIKDNPKGYWFRRKLYGYGWTPAKPAGWATTLIYLLFILAVVWRPEETNGPFSEQRDVIVFVIAATVLFIVITWRTGEPLKWQWGNKTDKKD